LVLNIINKYGTIGCPRILSEAIGFITLEHLPHSSEVWRCIHIPAVAVGKELHSRLRQALSCFLLWRLICVMYHINYMMTMSWDSQHCLFNCTLCKKQHGKMCSCKQRSENLKQKCIRTCLSWTLLLQSRCLAAYSITSAYN